MVGLTPECCWFEIKCPECECILCASSTHLFVAWSACASQCVAVKLYTRTNSISADSFLHHSSETAEICLLHDCMSNKWGCRRPLSSLHLLGSSIVRLFFLSSLFASPSLRTRRTALASQSPSSAYSEWWGWSNSWAEGRESGLFCGPSLNPSRSGSHSRLFS